MLYVPAMNIRSFARQAVLPGAIAVSALFGFTGTVAAATTPNSIEGVWSFSGGAVAIQPLSDGTFQGTVVSPTTFASCPHPEGQVMWTNMKPQTDGSFWGLHQWYRGPSCEEVPTLGHTAWRVLTGSSNARILRVCFDNPGGEVQPTIAPDGSFANVSYGCTDSNPLAALPQTEGPGNSGSSSTGVITFRQTVVLPTPKACISQTSLKISLKDPKYDPLTEVVVKIKGKKVADVKGVKRLKKGITLKKLPSGSYKISVTATTALKQHLTGSQSYKSCTKGSGKIKLKHVKKPKH
jgi:hypothetical protein